MKHDTLFPVEYLRQRALPDAPVVMPRQIVEQKLEWLGLVRFWTLVRLRRG